MPGSLRVFVSSTMRDLANERAEIVSRLSSLGLGPVNAEGFLPDGRNSWQKIEEEIRSSHIFVLVLGESYGWIPTEGHGAGKGLSVTHLEFRLAKEIGLPILPFVKDLEYSPRDRNDEEVLRDDFRKEVEDWQGGHIRANFELARDLGDMVQRAVVDYLCEPHLKQLVGKQDQRVQRFIALPDVPKTKPPKVEPEIRELLHNSCLIAGAGMSIGAGFPTALAFAESLSRKLGANGEVVESLELMCELFEEAFGRTALLDEVRRIVSVDYTTRPTIAHRAAVKNFRTIITSNYDNLFEQACLEENIEAQVFSTFRLPPFRPEPVGSSRLTIFKISGDLTRGEDLVLTSEDYNRVMMDASLWRYLDHLLWGCSPVVMGHSLSTPDAKRLVQEMTVDRPGIFVSPNITPITELRVSRLNLRTVAATADEFMSSMF